MADYKVVDVEQLDADLGTVADAIREQTGKTDEIVFPEGFKSAPAELVEIGKKAEYDAFWDAFLAHGNRTDFEYAFSGLGWTADTFKPKYSMKPVIMSNAFMLSNIACDLVALLDDLGVVFDFSETGKYTQAFQGAAFTRVPSLGSPKATGYVQCFYGAGNLVTIDSIMFTEACTNFGNTFSACRKLSNLTAKGVIVETISFSYCPLTAESAKSVIFCLKNFNGTGNEHTKTITFSGTTWSYLDAEGEASPNGTTWRDYITNSLCWNI